jgi:hypothetical protein
MLIQTHASEPQWKTHNLCLLTLNTYWTCQELHV